MAGVGLGADIRHTSALPSARAWRRLLRRGDDLVALNRIWNTGFTTDELAALGLRLGADVPVFVRGLASWAKAWASA